VSYKQYFRLNKEVAAVINLGIDSFSAKQLLLLSGM